MKIWPINRRCIVLETDEGAVIEITQVAANPTQIQVSVAKGIKQVHKSDQILLVEIAR